MKLSQIFDFLPNFFQFKLFTVNDTPITVSSILIFLIMFSALVILSRLFSRWLESKVLSKIKIDKGTSFIYQRISYYTLLIISAVFSLQFVGIDLSGLAVIFGLLSVGIGFGLQNVTSNFISGIILLFERPIKVGDRVTVGDTVGDVIAINMRSTTIRTFQNIAIIVPNSEFVSSSVINWSYSDPKIRLDLDVGVSYDSDLRQVKEVLRKIAKDNPEVMSSPEPRVLLLSFGDSAWDMQLQVWLQSPKDRVQVQSDINSEIVERFREHEIEIPFPQRDLHIRSQEPTLLVQTISEQTNGQRVQEVDADN